MPIRSLVPTIALSAACVALASTHEDVPDVPDLRWQVVLDGVMGGLSSGTLDRTGLGSLRFSGDLSLENNGGFSQIRSPIDASPFIGAEGVEIRVLGDGREYTFDIRTSNMRAMASSYQQTFATLDKTWLVFELPFSDFEFKSFGREIRGAPSLDPSLIRSIGITLADYNEGDFEIVIDEIRPYGSTRESDAARPPAPEQPTLANAMRIYELAIERGVPLFNNGSPEACAAVYEVAIEALIAMGTEFLGEPTVAVLQDSIIRARQQQSWADRAWTYRNALDEAVQNFRERMNRSRHNA